MSKIITATEMRDRLLDGLARPRVGRVETYVHSDSITRNKGGAMVMLVCGSEAGARTDEFVAFAKKVARLAYAAAATDWIDIVRDYPEMNDELFTLRKTLKENIRMAGIQLMTV